MQKAMWVGNVVSQWVGELELVLPCLVDHTVEVDGGGLLCVDGDDIRARLGKVGDAELRLHNHLHVTGDGEGG
jgi:hypothetical protein